MAERSKNQRYLFFDCRWPLDEFCIESTKQVENANIGVVYASAKRRPRTIHDMHLGNSRWMTVVFLLNEELIIMVSALPLARTSVVKRQVKLNE